MEEEEENHAACDQVMQNSNAAILVKQVRRAVPDHAELNLSGPF